MAQDNGKPKDKPGKPDSEEKGPKPGHGKPDPQPHGGGGAGHKPQ